MATAPEDKLALSRLMPIKGGARPDRAASGELVLVTRTGLRIPPELPYERWEQTGQRITDIIDSSAWCLGDWLLFGQTKYEKIYRRGVAALGLQYQTLRNYAWVARRFEPQRRRSKLSFQHHAEVAGLPADQQDYWLDQAEKNDWSRNELRANLRADRNEASVAQHLPLPRIMADRNRLDLWRVAAERSDNTLESWIVASLDAAASEVLGVDSAPRQNLSHSL